MSNFIQLDQESLNVPLYGLRGFDFSGVERNVAMDAMTKKEGSAPLKPKVASTGTTIVASVYKDGVIVGADSRSTYGNLIGDKNSMKLHKLTDSIYAAGAGTAAVLRHVTKMISAELKLFELNEAPKKARVLMAHRRLRQYLFQYQGHVGAYLLLGGVDYLGPHLYEVSASGYGYSIPYMADGSGSYSAMAELEDGFKPNMTEDECRNLIIKAVQAGMHGDNMSGNSYNLVTITAKGKLEEGPFIPSFSERPNEIEGDHTFAPGTSVVLKTKTLESLKEHSFGEITKKPVGEISAAMEEG